MEKDLLDNLIVILDEEYENDIDLFRKVVESEKVRPFVKDSYFDAIVAREKEYPTGISGPFIDFAIPHTDPQHLVEAFVVVIRPKGFVEFNPMGMAEEKAEAKLIVMLGIQKDGQQVEMLQKLMAFFMDETEIDDICNTHDEELIRIKMRKVLQ
ncbi:PTS sugar transporter subunit IIA [Enterococcus hulanensis]|uniref:PTS sugar transporter subunit IIA n=1 Tax=Enterococcus hulanensis TaxID=2559929 RepID=UPI00289138E5|nr:PTS sugar transporter subunit IIA [Enterococcus hulanensis]MDT2660746.1 PTS sugar transporter subunit IIA [Enterococcus hulanensis]